MTMKTLLSTASLALLLGTEGDSVNLFATLREGDLLVTIGAGDIHKLADALVNGGHE